MGEAEDKYHFVGELPLSMQAYRLLDRAGPSGMIQAVSQILINILYRSVFYRNFYDLFKDLTTGRKD